MTRSATRCAAVAGARNPRLAASGSLLVLFALVPSAACAMQTNDADRQREGATALRTGKYDQAIAIFTELARKPGARPGDQRALVRALAEVGRYKDAEEAARAATAANGATAAELRNVLGEVLYIQGKVDEAERAFGEAVTGRASDSLSAQLNLAILRYDRGERAEAVRSFDRFIDAYNERRDALTSEELTAVGVACRYLGRENPQLFKDALKAFDAAIAKDPDNLEPKVRAGELFLEKYNSADARGAIDEVLRVNAAHPRALVAGARRLHFDGAPGAQQLVRRALETNPNLVAARTLLATLHLDLEDHAQATAEAERALSVNALSLEALSVLAAARYFAGDQPGFEAARRRALARNPRYADLYNTLAELTARNRLYREATEFARQATSLDPKSSRAYALLGINELRIGAVGEAKAHLDSAFAGDPYDPWVKNTLDLLDTFKDYKDTRSERFLFMIEAKDAELLAPYATAVAEDAYTQFAARYGYRPPTPIRVEFYRSHADFSVRTVGLAGLGALGVSFGTVLAMDAPAARKVGEFNWGSTLWHEIAHTFTLGMTRHKVPRWLSEGISVYEERRARPGWGAHATVGFLAAYKAGRLAPVSRLNDGFVRPAYPEQVIFSYYQASLVCELIERDWGTSALKAMLEAYRDGLATVQVFQRVLKTDLASFDRRFDAYVRQRFASPLAAVRAAAPRGDSALVSPEGASRAPADLGDFATQLRQGRTLFEAGKKDEAVPFLERAKALFPDYAERDSPRWYLALIHKEKGALRSAADELARLTAVSDSHYEAYMEYADLLEKLGDHAGAAAVLDRVMYISPYDVAAHVRLATLAARTGDRARAVRERRAVVALNPVDRAEALYQLALAYHEAGDTQAARREVLRALEAAPNFEKAQELLLTLRRAGSGPGGALP